MIMLVKSYVSVSWLSTSLRAGRWARIMTDTESIIVYHIIVYHIIIIIIIIIFFFFFFPLHCQAKCRLHLINSCHVSCCICCSAASSDSHAILFIPFRSIILQNLSAQPAVTSTSSELSVTASDSLSALSFISFISCLSAESSCINHKVCSTPCLDESGPAQSAKAEIGAQHASRIQAALKQWHLTNLKRTQMLP